jgi:hypothetical protein
MIIYGCIFWSYHESCPKNKNAYLRYLIIHSQLKRNKYREGYPNKEDLLWVLNDQGYDVSGSTLEKDLNFLKNERGAPLEYNRYQKCYRYTDDWEFDVPLSPKMSESYICLFTNWKFSVILRNSKW